jgi:2-polyprenyl-3-methyl-5-hydroxy-6-metoxy-1,4-benzoquinol methylase
MQTTTADWETISCPLCGQERWQPLLRACDLLYRQPGEFQLVRCDGCRHVYLNPRPTAGTIRSFYPQDYAPHHLQVASTDCESTAAAKRSASRLFSALRYVPGLRGFYRWLTDTRSEVIPETGLSEKRAMELGCADGRFLKRLEEMGWETQGVELAEEPARRAQGRGLQVHVGPLQPGLFPAHYFDAVFAWMVIEHLHDPVAVLREIHRVLKSSGWLAFSVPNFACWERVVFGRYWYALQVPTHLQHFTPATVRRLLDQSGFNLVDLIHQRNAWNVVGSAGLWLRENAPRLRIGSRMIDWVGSWPICGRLALTPPAILLALLGQGGRLTVVAKPAANRDP